MDLFIQQILLAILHDLDSVLGTGEVAINSQTMSLGFIQIRLVG